MEEQLFRKNDSRTVGKVMCRSLPVLPLKQEGEEQCVSFSPILLPGCLYGTMTTRGSLKAPDFLFPFLGTDIPRDLQLPCCEIG